MSTMTGWLKPILEKASADWETWPAWQRGVEIEGTCLQCGLCCMSGLAQCEYLQVVGTPGEPGATHCRVWKTRYHKMPFRSLYPDGSVKHESECLILADALKEGLKLHMPEGCGLRIVDCPDCAVRWSCGLETDGPAFQSCPKHRKGVEK